MRTVDKKASNIIDLAELRRRQEAARRNGLAWQTSLVRQPEEEPWTLVKTPNFHPVVLTATPEERRRARRERRAWCLDICASLAVILTTAAFTLWVLI